MITAFFAYGTLKRGQCRERCWPRAPLSIEVAYTQATLYDLGPYPAIAPGEDWIEGELWRFAECDLTLTLVAIDAVEGFEPGRSRNLYDRREIICRTEGGETVTAYTYFFASAERLERAQRVLPSRKVNGIAVAVWPEE